MATQTQPHGQAQRPLSPWAARYGVFEPGDIFNPDNTVHSGFAPEQPSAHPEYFLDIQGYPNGQIPKPNDAELDHLFLTEKHQKYELSGYRTWQYATFKRWVDFGNIFVFTPFFLSRDSATAGNFWNRHSWDNFTVPIPAVIANNTTAQEPFRRGLSNQLFDRLCLGIGQTRWFGFFRRDRWFNTAAYSTDDPKVWAVLGRSVELANRILQSLVDDQHGALQTILYGRIDFVRNYRDDLAQDDQSLVLLSLRQERIESQKTGVMATGEYMTQYTPMDWRNRLESLLRGVIWSATKWETTLGWECGQHAQMETVALGTVQGTHSVRVVHAISLGDRMFRALLSGPDLSLSERCHLHHTLAVTMIHELMHAVIRARKYGDDQTFGNYLNPGTLFIGEPCVDFEDTNEIGEWCERQFFGGLWSSNFLAQHGITGVPLGLSRVSDQVEWIFPSLHTSKLLSKVFWANSSIPRKSDNFFHFNKIFSSESVADISQTPNVQQTREYQTLVPAYKNREAMWASLRAGWYAVEFNRWAGTLWSDLRLRRLLGETRYWFKHGDEIKCAYIADYLVDYMDWTNTVAFVNQLPTPGSEGNLDWYRHALGLLLMAAMPLRRRKHTRDTLSWTFDTSHSASSAASTASTANPLLPLGSVVRQTASIPASRVWGGTYEAEPSELFDPLAGRDIRMRPIISTQLDYLRVFRRLIGRIKDDGIIVQEPWVRNLLKAERQIRQKRTDPRFPFSKWIDRWPFEVPRYTTQNIRVRWDAASATWIPAP
ncbi:hypothetical protein GGR57DRAFT_515171 [Xylariaceae sp. FL1272]|nr:hypothetical protein GGR57DRAFT_515171 [Xylariaceae sp. FL1272]